MSRLFDRMLAHGIQHPNWFLPNPGEEQLLNDNLRKTSKDVVVISGDNVAEYLYSGTEQEEWDIDRDFPCLAPPFPSFFIECAAPTHIVSEVHGHIRVPKASPSGWGLFFTASSKEHVQPVSDEVLLRQYNALAHHYLASLKLKVSTYANAWEHFTEQEKQLAATMLALQDKTNMANLIPEGLEWLLEGVLFLEVARGQPVMGPIARWRFLLDAQGRVLHHFFGVSMDSEGSSPPSNDAARKFSTLVFAPLLTLSMLHCKNVELIDVKPPKKLSEAHKKRRGVPLCKYKTLEIEPFKQAAGPKGIDRQQLGRELRIRRGHFKDYRESGLFGKHKGLFWWDHVLKPKANTDYNVKI